MEREGKKNERISKEGGGGRLPSLLSLAVNSPTAHTTARCQLAAARFKAVTCDSQEGAAHPSSQLFCDRRSPLRHHFLGTVRGGGVYTAGHTKKKKHSVFDACPELHNSLDAARECFSFLMCPAF